VCNISFLSDEPDIIGPDGIQKLCKDLHLDPEDVSLYTVTVRFSFEYNA
jgi:hypothetical protein